MTIFLDTEFNGFGGSLISIAMVSDQRGRNSEFYGVCELPAYVHPWVEEHVLPVLAKAPEPDISLQRRMLDYLTVHSGETIIADWPEDFVHLLYLLCEPGGRAHRPAIEMRLVRGVEIVSKVPHNALSDARALMEWHQSLDP